MIKQTIRQNRSQIPINLKNMKIPQQPNLDESIQQVMRTLPPVIRNYVAKGEFTTVAKNITAKYGLRIDQSGVLARELMLLLVGIENPNDFMKALTEEAKIDEKTVRDIVQDVNKDVFIPLREKEENNAKIGISDKKTEEKKAEPTHHITPSSLPLIRKYTGSRTLPEHIAPLPPKEVLPEAVAKDSLQQSLKQTKDGTLQKKNKESLLSQKSIDEDTKVMDYGSQDKKLPESTTLKFTSPPKNLPGAMPPDGRGSIKGTLSTGEPSIGETKKEQVQRQSQSQPQPQPSQSTKAPSSPVTHYATDPYREPVDEHLDT